MKNYIGVKIVKAVGLRRMRSGNRSYFLQIAKIALDNTPIKAYIISAPIKA